MTISSLFGDAPTMSLLLKMLAYTIFYTGLIYLPLRIASDIVGRMQREAARRKQAQRHEALSLRTTFVIR